jgi:hypothetical protein
MTAGLLIDNYADYGIKQANNPKTEFISSNTYYKTKCFALANICSFFAYSDESWKFAGVATLGIAGAFWFNRRISQAASSHENHEKIQLAVNLGYLGMACWIAVPAAAFTWHAVQLVKG